MSKPHEFQVIVDSAKQLLVAIRENCPLDDEPEPSSNPWLLGAAKQAIGNPASLLRYWLTRDPVTELNINDADARRRRIFTLYKGSPVKLRLLLLDEAFFSIEPRLQGYTLPRFSSAELERLESAIQSLENAVQIPPESPRGEDPNDGPLTIECHVTLTQIAAIVNKSKRTIERLKGDGKLPAPAVKGGEGKADEWRWSEIRPILEKEFGRQLPDTFPADRFIRR